MAISVGRNVNSNNVSNITSVALNSTTTVKISDAKEKDKMIFFAISNNSTKDVWLKLQAAAVDDDKKGIFMPKGSYWEMPPDNVYIGEISAIADNGTPTIFITEY